MTDMEGYPNHFQWRGITSGHAVANFPLTFVVKPDPLAPIINEDWDAHLEFCKFTLTDVVETSTMKRLIDDASPGHIITIGLHSPNFTACGPDDEALGPALAYMELQASDPTNAFGLENLNSTVMLNNQSYFTLKDPHLFRNGGEFRFHLRAEDADVKPTLIQNAYLGSVIAIKFVKRRNIPRKNPKYKHYG